MGIMKFSWATLTLLTAIVIFSIFVANVANLINIDRHAGNKMFNSGAGSSSYGGYPAGAGDDERIRMGTSKQHLMWFLQVSRFCGNEVLF